MAMVNMQELLAIGEYTRCIQEYGLVEEGHGETAKALDKLVRVIRERQSVKDEAIVRAQAAGWHAGDPGRALVEAADAIGKARDA